MMREKFLSYGMFSPEGVVKNRACMNLPILNLLMLVCFYSQPARRVLLSIRLLKTSQIDPIYCFKCLRLYLVRTIHLMFPSIRYFDRRFPKRSTSQSNPHGFQSSFLMLSASGSNVTLILFCLEVCLE